MYKSILFSLMCIVSQGLLAFEYTLELTEAEIQSRIDAMLPIKKETFIVVVTVDQAQVLLLENTDKVALHSKLFVNSVAGINAQGQLALEGRVAYEAEQGAFYLKEANITELQIDKVPADFMPQLKQLAQSGLTQALSKKPIYVLKEDDMRHKLIKASLKSIEITQQKLKATLGI